MYWHVTDFKLKERVSAVGCAPLPADLPGAPPPPHGVLCCCARGLSLRDQVRGAQLLGAPLSGAPAQAAPLLSPRYCPRRRRLYEVVVGASCVTACTSRRLYLFRCSHGTSTLFPSPDPFPEATTFKCFLRD